MWSVYQYYLKLLAALSEPNWKDFADEDKTTAGPTTFFYEPTHWNRTDNNLIEYLLQNPPNSIETNIETN